MDLLVVSINAVVVAAVGAIVAWLGRGRFEAMNRRFGTLDHRIDRLESRLDGRIDGLDGRIERLETRLDCRFDGLDGRIERLDTRMNGWFETLQSSVDTIRSDLTQIALAVGVRPRAGGGGARGERRRGSCLEPIR